MRNEGLTVEQVATLKAMGSGKGRKPSKLSLQQNPKNKSKPLGPKIKKKKKKQRPNNAENENQIESKAITQNDNHNSLSDDNKPLLASASAQLNFFLDKFQSANRVQLSSLELNSLTDKCILDLSESVDQDVEILGNHMKAAFGSSWKKELCEKHLLEGKVDPGNPAILIISTSALRSIELLRGFRSLTKECHAVKLFSKHMKVEEQVSLLKDRVNIASGTPNRIKKLIDIEALGLSRLSVIVLDMHPDVKGYSLFTLPQVRDEFWDLYKNYFHQRLLQGDYSNIIPKQRAEALQTHEPLSCFPGGAVPKQQYRSSLIYSTRPPKVLQGLVSVTKQTTSVESDSKTTVQGKSQVLK